MLDARAWQEKEKTKNTRPKRAERKTHRGGKGRPLGRSENKEPNPNPETQKKPKKHQNRTGKLLRKTGTFLEEREQADEAIGERELGHNPQGDYQTSAEAW